MVSRYLVFKINNIRFGIAADRISQMMPLKLAKDQNLSVTWFHEKIVLKDDKVTYRTPTVLRIKGQAAGIVIDQPENIIRISKDDVRPLPGLIRQYPGTGPIASAALKGASLIFLTNMDRLIQNGS